MVTISKIKVDTKEALYEACADLYDYNQHLLLVGIQGTYAYTNHVRTVFHTDQFVYFSRSRFIRIQPLTTSFLQQFELWGISFNADLVIREYLRLHHQCGEEGFISIAANTFRRIQLLCQILQQEFTDRRDYFIMANILNSILVMIGQEVGSNPITHDKQEATYRQLLYLVNLHFMKPCKVDFYAKELSTTTRRLNLICKQVAQMSIMDVIEMRRLQEAKLHLISSDKRIQEISAEIGYREPSYFINVFKNRFGITPQEFRLNMKHLLFRNFEEGIFKAI